jgi:hypothetical protein
MPIRFQVDGDFYDHPKTIGMSDSAIALWTRAGSYCVAKLLDGFVPEDALRLLSEVPDEAASELVGRGLWRRVKGGFRFHQWDHRNLTRARVEADREYDRTRKQRERQAARQNGNQQVNANNVRSGHPPDTRPDSERSPNRSVSVSVSESVSGSGQAASRASPEPEPPRTCPEHDSNPNPPPCGHCADARRRHDRWQAARNARQATAPKCRTHRGQLAHNCALCRAERLEAIPPEGAP